MIPAWSTLPLFLPLRRSTSPEFAFPAARQAASTTVLRRFALNCGLWCWAVLWASFAGGAEPASTRPLDFNRDVRPILSDRCYRCHGPDNEERQAGLRLDDRESATQPAESGATAIVPGNASASELLRRIQATNDDEVMPPPSSKKSLTADEKRLLEQWIAQGAPYAQHWSFVPAVRPELPAVRQAEWPRTPIDHFVLARQEELGFQPAPPADKATLIRRVTLDLTGLPPTLAEVDAFLADNSADAYERVVDRLLASPHFGERLALEWLDASRFADTNGYHLDNGRDMSAWRAWVIEAFNRNLPFDQFTIEQLAGDLLPEASLAQKIASGFNRNHMINFEGGAIPEEYHTAYIVDRVNTTATVWLGLTVACAQCHDHKYDPISQREYYQLYAFFNNVPENGLDGNQGNAQPMVRIPSTEQQVQLVELRRREQAAQTELARVDAELQQQRADWESQKLGQSDTAEGLCAALQKPNAERSDAERQEVDKAFRQWCDEQPQYSQARQAAESAKKSRETLERQVKTVMVMSELEQPRETFMLVRGQYDKKSERVAAAVPASLPSLDPDLPNNRLGLARWLMDPQQPLTSRVLINRYWQMLFGVGLVKTAEDFGAQGERPSHPELLDWLASEFREAAHPSVDDHAAWNLKHMIKLMVMSATYQQSSHVAREIRERDPENRWLTSGPRFRLPAEHIRDQALAVSGLLRHRVGGPSVNPYQPEGLWGELSSRGDSANWTAQFFELSKGDDLYRRSMYTFWKRTCPPPQMSTFDAPDRETCTVRRARTNTPLQALILLNDPTYVEASRKLAERILSPATADAADPEADVQRLKWAFRTVTARWPEAAELEVLNGLLARQREQYRADEQAAQQLLSNGQSPAAQDYPAPELAAWTMVASTLLNLDETVTKP